MNAIEMDIQNRVKQIRLIAMDVDGVLTDGGIILGNDGEELKRFHAQDGMGITLAHKAGVKTAIITGRESKVVRRRGEELKITEVHQGIADKVTQLNDILHRHALTWQQVAYVGDDLNDLPLLARVAFACAPANAVAEVKQCAHYVAVHTGGNGAIREIIELILKRQDVWQEMITCYTNHPQDFIMKQ